MSGNDFNSEYQTFLTLKDCARFICINNKECIYKETDLEFLVTDGFHRPCQEIRQERNVNVKRNAA